MITRSVTKALASMLVLSGVLAITQTAVQAAENDEVIRFGVLPITQPETMAKRFNPLIEYLEQETGYDFELRTYSTGSKTGGYKDTPSRQYF